MRSTNMDYFFRKIHTVTSRPTTTSSARVRTIGIDHLSFPYDGTVIRFVDIGGQRCERTKIDQVKGSCTASRAQTSTSRCSSCCQ
jgi:hypothetical protein